MKPQSPTVQMLDKPREKQPVEGFGLSAQDMMDLMSAYEPFGLWRIELDSGQTFWSSDTYRVLGLEPSQGAADFRWAIQQFHPEDAEMIARVLEEAIERKGSFRFALRLKQTDRSYELIHSVGCYRERQDGTEEMIGFTWKQGTDELQIVVDGDPTD